MYYILADLINILCCIVSSKNNLSRNIQDESTSTKSPQKKKAAVGFGEAYKGQLISKCLFGFFKSTKKSNEIFVKRSNQKRLIK